MFVMPSNTREYHDSFFLVPVDCCSPHLLMCRFSDWEFAHIFLFYTGVVVLEVDHFCYLGIMLTVSLRIRDAFVTVFSCATVQLMKRKYLRVGICGDFAVWLICLATIKKQSGKDCCVDHLRNTASSVPDDPPSLCYLPKG